VMPPPPVVTHGRRQIRMCDLGASAGRCGDVRWRRGDPTGCRNVEKDRDPAIGLGPRFPDEGDTSLGHPQVSGVEVVDAEEVPDPAGYLAADCAAAGENGRKYDGSGAGVNLWPRGRDGRSARIWACHGAV
jgi:hypothetical protein